MVTMKKIIVLILFILGTSLANAQDVKVVSSGQGTTEDEAIKIALRTALEDAFGTFISSSTEIVNDILISDEIVSLTQGNIKEYNIVNSSRLEKRLYSVTVESIVSLNKLSSYCESKGMSINLDLSALSMDLKMQEFNRLNEKKVLKNLCNQILLENPQLFNFKIKTAKPIIKNSKAYVPIKIIYQSNSNYRQLRKSVIPVLKSISLDKSEREIYRELGLRLYSTKIWGSIYYFRDESCSEIISNFISSYEREISNNWNVYDNIGLIPFGIRQCSSFDILGKDNPYPSYSLLEYSQEEMAKLKSIDIESFDEMKYKNVIKPKLLKISSSFDNVK